MPPHGNPKPGPPAGAARGMATRWPLPGKCLSVRASELALPESRLPGVSRKRNGDASGISTHRLLALCSLRWHYPNQVLRVLAIQPTLSLLSASSPLHPRKKQESLCAGGFPYEISVFFFTINLSLFPVKPQDAAALTKSLRPACFLLPVNPDHPGDFFDHGHALHDHHCVVEMALQYQVCN